MRWIAATLALLTGSLALAAARPPNIIHIIGDDVAYDDLSCYGAKKINTPNLDALAAQGVRFTSFYASSALCTPTRAALMTGCYPQRVGLPAVLYPNDTAGLHPDEVTIAELLRGKGYATACIGKWHLGHHPQHLPTNHGFDYFYGIPYPNDHGPERVWKGGAPRGYPPIPLLRNTQVIESPAKLQELPDRFVEESLSFIAQNKDKPFFLHLSNIETHTPWFTPRRFEGKSQDGPYGDAVQCMDWMVGQVMQALDEHGLAENTLLVFTSDNGPFYQPHKELEHLYGKFATVDPARPHQLRAGKYHARWEGGVRVPAIARWPGRIVAGRVSGALAAGFDLYATFASVAGAELPADRIVDAIDLTPLLTGASEESGRDTFYYYASYKLMAVRKGDMKLVLPGPPGPGEEKTMLYDVNADPGETTDLAPERPAVVAELQQLAERAREDLGDGPKRRGKNRRPAADLNPPR